MQGAFVGKKKCISLPSPAMQYPSLLVPEREETHAAEMSCAKLACANLQSLNINAEIAVQASQFLTLLLVTHDLKRFTCAVNMESGVVKSFYITEEEMARETSKPISYLTRTPEEQALMMHA